MALAFIWYVSMIVLGHCQGCAKLEIHWIFANTGFFQSRAGFKDIRTILIGLSNV